MAAFTCSEPVQALNCGRDANGGWGMVKGHGGSIKRFLKNTVERTITAGWSLLWERRVWRERRAY